MKISKITNRISYRIIRPFYWIRFYRNRIFRFIIPNLFKIIEREITFDGYPVCNQKLLITGKGSVQIGANCSFGYKPGGNFYKGLIEFQPRYIHSKIIIGNNVVTNNNLMLCAANLIKIGEDSLIGQGVTILDHEAHGLDPTKRRQLGESGTVMIGKNVWIGNNVTVLKNSEIGENTVVAVGAVVSGRFPSNVIIGGVPAKVIKNL